MTLTGFEGKPEEHWGGNAKGRDARQPSKKPSNDDKKLQTTQVVNALTGSQG